MNRELKFLKYFKDYTKEVLKCELLYTEYSLYNALSYLERNSLNKTKGDKPVIESSICIGRIDAIIKYQKTGYVVEIKYGGNSNDDFWSSLKVVGYCAYYNWINNTHFKPAIMIPINEINLEHKIISNILGIAIFGIYEIGDKYKVEKVDKN